MSQVGRCPTNVRFPLGWPIENPAISDPRPNEPIRLIDKVALEMLDVGKLIPRPPKDRSDRTPKGNEEYVLHAKSSRLGK